MARKPASAKGHVMRVSHAIFAKLKAFRGDATLNDTIDALLTAGELLRDTTQFYKAGDRVFNDVADARGYALRLAVREQRTPELPDVLVCVGQDNGD